MTCTFRAVSFWLLNLKWSGLQVSSIRASKSDDKRLSIFTGTKTLHLRCLSREDRASWIEALLAAKDLFPRVLSSNDLVPSEDIVVSTEKLRLRLAQEGVGEPLIKDCESIMLLEVSELQNRLKALQSKHVMLLDTLRQLEVFLILFLLTIKIHSVIVLVYQIPCISLLNFYFVYIASIWLDGKLARVKSQNLFKFLFCRQRK